MTPSPRASPFSTCPDYTLVCGKHTLARGHILPLDAGTRRTPSPPPGRRQTSAHTGTCQCRAPPNSLVCGPGALFQRSHRQEGGGGVLLLRCSKIQKGGGGNYTAYLPNIGTQGPSPLPDIGTRKHLIQPHIRTCRPNLPPHTNT